MAASDHQPRCGHQLHHNEVDEEREMVSRKQNGAAYEVNVGLESSTF